MATVRKDQRQLEMALVTEMGKQEEAKVCGVKVQFAMTLPA